MSEIKFVSVSAGKILFPLTEDNKVSGVIEHKGKTFNINEIVTDGAVVFVRILNNDLKQDLLDQFNIVVPFNPNGIINELSRPC